MAASILAVTCDCNTLKKFSYISCSRRVVLC